VTRVVPAAPAPRGIKGVLVQDRWFVIGKLRDDGSFELTRLPDGLALTARSWDDVWATCPEFGVRWRSVEFLDGPTHDLVVTAWGRHPDMPTRPPTSNALE